VELNGSASSFSFTTGTWNELQYGPTGGPGLKALPVPREFWTWPGSPRDPGAGDPLVTFRYDQAWEFIDAIRNNRPCVPSFHDGVRMQAVIDAALSSAETRQWVDVQA
jgi:predicted dehydrogenase